MSDYSVKKLSKLSGVSIRTLHVYDQMGLLEPSHRTAAGYRVYGEEELLKLQQILFYKELGFSLREITQLVNDPHFNVIKALESHKLALASKQNRIMILMDTLEQTIINLKEKNMLDHETLYAGFSKEEATARRAEASRRWGAENLEKSEEALIKRGKDGFKRLMEESREIAANLFALRKEDPHGVKVQYHIERHYQVIRKFWGTEHSEDPQAEAYAGLGQLYVDDERFTLIDGRHDAGFALFMSKAMKYYAQTNLGLG